MKRALSFVLSLVMGFSVLTVSASAAQKLGNSPAQETRSIKGRAASSAMVEMLEEEGIPVTEDTTIRLLPLSSAEMGIASQSANGDNMLVITNEEGTTVRQDALLLFTDDGIGFANMDKVTSWTDIYFDHTHKNDKVMVHGIAFYDKHSNGHLFYRPIKVQVHYTKYKECNVSSLGAGYNCSGGLYSFPDLEFQEPAFTYSIVVKQTNPVEGRVYGKQLPLLSSRVIGATSGGGPQGAGNNLTLNVVVDGKLYDPSVNFY